MEIQNNKEEAAMEKASPGNGWLSRFEVKYLESNRLTQAQPPEAA